MSNDTTSTVRRLADHLRRSSVAAITASAATTAAEAERSATRIASEAGGAALGEISAHIARVDNPHAVAAAQLPDFESAVETVVRALLVAGSNVGIAYDAVAGTLTISASGGGGAALSDATPAPLGTAAAGTATTAGRGDHVHALPTATQVGAEPALGAPAADGYLLSSSAAGVRAWTPIAVADWATLTGKPATFAPSAHAAAHGVAGSDPLLSAATPAALGTATAGATGRASDAGHAHAMPTAGDVGAVPATGGTFTGAVTLASLSAVGTGAGAAAFAFDGAAGEVRDFRYMSGGVLRWVMRADNAAESGSNAGSDFIIIRRADDGSYIADALKINRSSGLATFGARLKAASFETAAGSQWQLAGYTAAGDAASNGYVTVTINGTAYKLSTRA